MAEHVQGAALPVESATLDAELKAALERIAMVPVGRTLVDDVDSELWHSGVDGNIEAGSAELGSDELDDADAPAQQIA